MHTKLLGVMDGGISVSMQIVAEVKVENLGCIWTLGFLFSYFLTGTSLGYVKELLKLM